MSESILRVENLVAGFHNEKRDLFAVDGVSFELKAGQSLGLVGESGSGKSVTAMSLLRLLPNPDGRIYSGDIWFEEVNLTNMPLPELRKLRGNEISMIFQEPMTALNPVQTVGRQLMEALLQHKKLSRHEALTQSVALLAKVGIPSPEERFNQYPHHLSGGMKQRVMIAIALSCGPKVLIADEPTTALDVTVQAQILDLLQNLRRENHMALLLITHDLAVIAENCDEVVVMYAGRIVERAPVAELFANPVHAYTRALLSSMPRLDHPRKALLPTISGMVPTLSELLPGCRFANRAEVPHERALFLERPPYREISPGHWIEACPACTDPTYRHAP